MDLKERSSVQKLESAEACTTAFCPLMVYSVLYYFLLWTTFTVSSCSIFHSVSLYIVVSHSLWCMASPWSCSCLFPLVCIKQENLCAQSTTDFMVRMFKLLTWQMNTSIILTFYLSGERLLSSIFSVMTIRLLLLLKSNSLACVRTEWVLILEDFYYSLWIHPAQ